MSQITNFIHLHGHSEYSALDGSASIDEVVLTAKNNGQSAIALTEHGNVDSAFKFIKEATKQGIKPIIGAEMYFAANGIESKDHNTHIVLLCKNFQGWQNLLKMIQISSVDGFYYKPRIDFDILRKYSKGLIVLTGCMNGIISHYLLNKHHDIAVRHLTLLKDIFHCNLYIEIQNHNTKEDVEVVRELVKLSKELKIKMVATNDFHYAKKEDSIIQDILMCSGRKQGFFASDRKKMGDDSFYIKSYDEMYDTMVNLFKKVYEGAGGNHKTIIKKLLANSLAIADKCNVKYPDYKIRIAPIHNSVEIFDNLINSAMNNKFKYLFSDDRYIERVKEEVEIIKEAGLVEYFLIVHDFINYAKTHGISVGAGRGSVGGCLVGYLLGIHTVDPIRYNLLFSRFYNQGRKGSLPDIDIDFGSSDIVPMLKYIENKYGYNKVAHIGTMTTYAPRGAFKAICRVMQVPYQEANSMVDLIDKKSKNLTEALELNPSLKDKYINERTLYSGSLMFKELYDYAIKIEGKISHKGIHAAGIVISPFDLNEMVPLRKEKTSNLLVTCWDMEDIEANGFIKYDFLKIDILDALKYVFQYDVLYKSIDDIPVDDGSIESKKAYELLSTTNNVGIFQLSGGMGVKIANSLRPEKMEDIAVAITLNRPGCINLDLHTKYIKRKNDEENAVCDFSILEDVLKDTQMLMIYQEQIIKTCIKIGFTSQEADTVRKIMGKKKPELLEKVKPEFFDKAQSNTNLTVVQIGELWNHIYESSGYMFNKCIDGDCYINNEKHNPKYTIGEMYYLKNNKIPHNGKKYSMSCRYKRLGYGYAKNIIDGKIFIDKIKDIYYQGKKDVYLIILENGKSITTTINHKFPIVDNGFKTVEELQVGDKLYCIGEYQKTNSIYSFSNQKQICKGKTYSNTKSGFPDGEDNPGYIDGEYTKFCETKNRIEHVNVCQLCGNEHNRLEHHHNDGDRNNNNFENISKLCPSCHKKEHYKLGRKKKWSKGLSSEVSSIVSIKHIGTKDVYDIEMENEPHNLFVNGIATCNSHAVGYAHISYYTAFMKANYPIEYMCSLLNTCLTDVDKLNIYLEECRNMGIEILSPSVTKSKPMFSIYENKIVYGLLGIKGLGKEAIESLLKNQSYVNFSDFCEKTRLNKNYIEVLAKAGALDDFEYNRATIISNSQTIVNSLNTIKKHESKKISPLFSYNVKIPIKECLEYDDRTLAEMEYSVINSYISTDPLVKYREWIKDKIKLPEEIPFNYPIKVAGYIQSIEYKTTKNDKPYVDIKLYAPERTWRILVFSQELETSRFIIDTYKVIWVDGIYKESGLIFARNIGIV